MWAKHQRGGGDTCNVDVVLKLASEHRIFLVVLSNREACRTTTNMKTAKELHRIGEAVEERGKTMDKMQDQLDQRGEMLAQRGETMADIQAQVCLQSVMLLGILFVPRDQ